MASSTINKHVTPNEIARGSITSGTVTGGGTDVTFSVSFGKTLSAVPTVVTSITQYGAFNIHVSAVRNITTTGFDVIVRNAASSSLNFTANRRLDWIAICI